MFTGTNMTYIVDDACIKCKYTDCVDVCPVDCFYEGPNFMVIDPDGCIDCGVCQPECPAGAIYPDTIMSNHLQFWKDKAAELSKTYKNCTEKKDPMPCADAWNPLINKEIKDKTDLLE